MSRQLHHPLRSDQGFVDMIQLRPGERLQRFLMEEQARSREGDRLPTIRKMSSCLGISSVTIRNVLKKFIQDGHIVTKRGSGTYWTIPQSSRKRDCHRVAINVEIHEDQKLLYWGSQIAGWILHFAAISSPRMDLVPIKIGAMTEQEISKQIEMVDGLILFPMQASEALHQTFISLHRPVVHINPPSESEVVNYVSTDYYESARVLARTWKNTGRKNILYIRMNGPSVSDRLRYGGMAVELMDGRRHDITLTSLETSDGTEESGYSLMQQVMERSNFPDAIYAASDLPALGIVRYCKDHKIKVPEQMSIVGGSGIDLSSSQTPFLTRLNQPMHKIAQEAVSMLGKRLENSGKNEPRILLPAIFGGGSTTRRVENDLLGITMIT